MEIFNLIENPQLWKRDEIFLDFVTDPDFDFLKSKSTALVKAEICETFLLNLNEDVTKNPAIIEEINEAVSTVLKDFPALSPSVYIFEMSDKNDNAIKNTFGVSATAATRRIILSIHLNSWHKDHIKACLVHELNHVARLQHFQFFKTGTLLDWMILEGMTELYQHERLPWHRLSPWCTTATPTELDQFFPLVRKEFNVPNSESSKAKEWIFGTNEIPKWFGYALGFDIVQRFRWRNPTTPWAELITIPSENFLEGYSR